jgi:hypothetical protein
LGLPALDFLSFWFDVPAIDTGVGSVGGVDIFPGV